MQKLTKAQETARAQLVNDLREAAADVGSAASEVNTIIIESLNAAIANYNSALSALTEFKDEVVSQMEAYYDSRTDAWRDGEAGSNYTDWKDEWENVGLDEVDDVDEVEAPDVDHADSFDALPSEPGV